MARRVKRWWWNRFTLPWRVVGEVDSADEVPEELPYRGAVVVVSGTTPKWIAFDCPCSEPHRVLLNLDPSRYPSWRIRRGKKGQLSISPSVSSFENGRNCHYFIREGRVLWAKQ